LAEFFNDQEGVPSEFSCEDVLFFPGATLITKALCHIFSNVGTAAVLFSKPGYPVYENQCLADGLNVGHYELDSRRIATFEMLNAAVERTGGVRLVVLTYPHNPTGKALDVEEAKLVANAVNRLNEKYQDLLFYNDCVYSATCSVDFGYNSRYQYLTDSAKQMTISGHSGAKLASMGGERLGGIATKNKLLLRLMANAQSQMTAGVSVHAIPGFLATTILFRNQWGPGAALGKSRAVIADYYQQRIKIVAEALPKEVLSNLPGGGMYVYADFTALLKGRAVPSVCVEDVGSVTLESDRNLCDLLLSVHRLGLIPVSTVPGSDFGDDPQRITLRISCVERNIHILKYAVSTIKALMQILLANDPESADSVAAAAAAAVNVEAFRLELATL